MQLEKHASENLKNKVARDQNLSAALKAQREAYKKKMEENKNTPLSKVRNTGPPSPNSRLLSSKPSVMSRLKTLSSFPRRPSYSCLSKPKVSTRYLRSKRRFSSSLDSDSFTMPCSSETIRLL